MPDKFTDMSIGDKTTYEGKENLTWIKRLMAGVFIEPEEEILFPEFCPSPDCCLGKGIQTKLKGRNLICNALVEYGLGTMVIFIPSFSDVWMQLVQNGYVHERIGELLKSNDYFVELQEITRISNELPSHQNYHYIILIHIGAGQAVNDLKEWVIANADINPRMKDAKMNILLNPEKKAKFIAMVNNCQLTAIDNRKKVAQLLELDTFGGMDFVENHFMLQNDDIQFIRSGAIEKGMLMPIRSCFGEPTFYMNMSNSYPHNFFSASSGNMVRKKEVLTKITRADTDIELKTVGTRVVCESDNKVVANSMSFFRPVSIIADRLEEISAGRIMLVARPLITWM